MKNRKALVIMAKAPIRGAVKTRLRGALSEEGLLSLYTSMVDKTIEGLRAVEGADTFVAYAPTDAGGHFEKYGLPAFAQPEGDIGERMHAALQKVLARGYDMAALVGVDIPGLAPRVVGGAFRLLCDFDVVFGPASDGGYYLVGLKAPAPGLFKGVEWSTERTLKQSLERASSLGLRAALSETLSDVDTPEDLASMGIK